MTEQQFSEDSRFSRCKYINIDYYKMCDRVWDIEEVVKWCFFNCRRPIILIRLDVIEYKLVFYRREDYNHFIKWFDNKQISGSFVITAPYNINHHPAIHTKLKKLIVDFMDETDTDVRMSYIKINYFKTDILFAAQDDAVRVLLRMRLSSLL